VLWIDAGVCVLHRWMTRSRGLSATVISPSTTARAGPGGVPTGLRGLRVERAFTRARRRFPRNLVGFKKARRPHPGALAEALRVASVEDCHQALFSAHKQDQAILSALLYKRAGMGPPDPRRLLPETRLAQSSSVARTWVPADHAARKTAVFQACVGVGGAPHIPKDPMKDISALRIAFRRAVLPRRGAGGSPLLMRLRARLRAGAESENMNVYVINLDKTARGCALVSGSARESGCPFERVAGVYGRGLVRRLSGRGSYRPQKALRSAVPRAEARRDRVRAQPHFH
jgi:hypothetical protein